MAGKFRGQVSKIPKAKQSKTARKGKSVKVVALVKRSPKLANNVLQTRIAQLTSSVLSKNSAKAQKSHLDHTMSQQQDVDQIKQFQPIVASKQQNKKNSRLSKVKNLATPKSLSGTNANSQIFVKKKQKNQTSSPAHSATQAAGLTMLRAAVRNQSHNRLLPHQNRHDYEYRLRNIATIGVVKLFNSLATAHKAGQAVLKSSVSEHLTQQKAVQKKQVLSRDAFLAALRQPPNYDGQAD